MDYSFAVESEQAGERLDRFLSVQIGDVSRSSIVKLCDMGNVLVNSKPCGKNYKIREKDVITVTVPEPKEMEAKAENIPLDIVYEDNDLLVVNKPKGMVVHPAPGNYSGTLVNALLFHCKDSLSGINGVLRPGIVHRIDKDTSGLLIVAKNDKAHIGLAEQIQVHSFSREYEAVVYGNLKNPQGTVDAPIGRHKTDRKKMCVTAQNSKNAVTHYSLKEYNNGFSYVSLRLETGRTHQIRVHMAYIGHPVAGDAVYGPKNVIKSLNGQCLHAKKIGFIHPITGQMMNFDSELPPYFKEFLNNNNLIQTFLP